MLIFKYLCIHLLHEIIVVLPYFLNDDSLVDSFKCNKQKMSIFFMCNPSIHVFVCPSDFLSLAFIDVVFLVLIQLLINPFNLHDSRTVNYGMIWKNVMTATKNLQHHIPTVPSLINNVTSEKSAKKKKNRDMFLKIILKIKIKSKNIIF